MDLSIIILNYKTREITLDCLKSIFASDLGNYQIEVILVDNASLDGSVETFAKIKIPKNISFEIIENQKNLGFAGGNNVGLKKARGAYLLLLNSDVLLQKETLKKQLEFMQNYVQYHASTCKLLLKNGKIDPACHRGFPTPWNSFAYFSRLEKIFPDNKFFGGYHQGFRNLKEIHTVDAISGAFFMIKKEALDKLGFLDEAFFMYGEDLDWCLRLKNLGLKIGFYPQNQALHLKGFSGREKQDKKIKQKSDLYFWQAMKIFYQKHYEKQYSSFLNFLIYQILNYKIKQFS
ncbi:glycosyltransferase [Candidatus Beckwithbacteria bacterium]|nr:glycosyltransferase [Candidatus Beckwithbacteria bacterium]